MLVTKRSLTRSVLSLLFIYFKHAKTFPRLKSNRESHQPRVIALRRLAFASFCRLRYIYVLLTFPVVLSKTN